MTIPWLDKPGPIWNVVASRPVYSPGLCAMPVPNGVQLSRTVVWRIDSTRPQGKLEQSGSLLLCANAGEIPAVATEPANANTRKCANDRPIIASLRQCAQVEHRVKQRSRLAQRA